MKPSSACLPRSPALRGWPCASRYAGLARMRSRLLPVSRLCSVESFRRPIRIATSVRRSSRSMTPSLLFSSSSTRGKRSRWPRTLVPHILAPARVAWL
ncbi:hypothetical protein DM56_4721 [Burkholderia mallei]|nr:hypothetical protein DM56_4721 [Burkholderia mallei]